MIKKIEIGDHCFGEFAIVDDVELRIDTEVMSMAEVKEVDGVMANVIKELLEVRRDLSINDWKTILTAIAVNKEYDLIEDSNNTCEQCGNWNYTEVYSGGSKSEPKD